MKHPVAIFILLSLRSLAQMNGTVSVPGTYSTLAAAIAALNNNGTTSGVTVQVAAGYTETVPAGGYSLYASGAAMAPIVFSRHGNGPNPLLFAYTGTKTPGASMQDGLWRLIGCDYVTIDGIDLRDPNISNPGTMEFGYALFKASGTDGCHYVTISHCTVTLNNINNAAGSAPAADGSRGIDIVNALAGQHNVQATVTSNSGAHTDNVITGNVIRGCNVGISLYGFSDNAPFVLSDHSNAVSGNTIMDFGGGGTVSACAAVRAYGQYDIAVTGNSICNNDGGGANHAATLRGIYLTSAPSSDIVVSGNTLTLHGGGTSSQVSLIECAAGPGGTTNAVDISSNVFFGCTNRLATSGSWYGIWNTTAAGTLQVNSNVFAECSSAAQTGSEYLIYNTANAGSLSVQSNTLSYSFMSLLPFSGTFYGIFNNAAQTSSVVVAGNIFMNASHRNAPGSGNLYVVANTATCVSLVLSANRASRFTLNHAGAFYFLYNQGTTTTSLSVTSNTLSQVIRTAAAGNMYGYYSSNSAAVSSPHTFTGNLVANISAVVPGTGAFGGIYDAQGAGAQSPVKAIASNTICDIDIASTGNVYGLYLSEAGDAAGTNTSVVSSNIVSRIFASNTLYGICIAGAASQTNAVAMRANTVSILSTLNSSVSGVWLGPSSGLCDFTRNRISEVNGGTAATAFGILVSGSGSLTIANNLVGNISAAAGGSNRANGIYLATSAAVNLFYNTVCLPAAATPTNAGSNALYAFTGATLLINNNVFANMAAPSGTSIAAAYRRSGTANANYLTGSNNNLFYAGIPGPNNAVFYNGTAYSNLAAFKTYVTPRESQSVTQNPTFSSLNPASPQYEHMAENVTSVVESAAAMLANITNDHDLEARFGSSGYSGGGSAPDIGADEFEMNAAPCATVNMPVVTALTPTLCAGATATLSAYTPTVGSGIAYQWKSAPTPSASFVNASGNANANEYVTGTLSAGVYYYALEIGCAAASSSILSASASVTVSVVPQVSASATPTMLCTGQSLSLSGACSSNGDQFWSGPGGFSAPVANPVFSVHGSGATGTYSYMVTANGCPSQWAAVTVTVADVDVIASVSDPVICQGMQTVLSVSTSAASFTWSGGSTSSSIIVTPTASAIYSLTATGPNGCTASTQASVTVVQPAVSATGAVVCDPPGPATLIASGFPSSSVSWYTSASSTIAIGSGTSLAVSVGSNTTFYVVASASLNNAICQSSFAPVAVTVATHPTITAASIPSAVCAGKQATLSVTGAMSASWSSGSSATVAIVTPSLPLSSYTVSGWDTWPCTATATLAVVALTLPAINISGSALTVCPSSSVLLMPAGAVSYTWSTGSVTNIATVYPPLNTVYSCTGTAANGCSNSATISIATRSVPVVKISVSPDTICAGESATLTVSGASNYTWMPGGATGTVAVFQPVATSAFNAIGSAANGCTNVAFAIVETMPCTNLNSEATPSISLSPSPVTDVLFIHGTIPFQSVRVISIDGTILVNAKPDNNSIDMSGLANGVYQLQIVSARAIMASLKIIKLAR